MTFHELGVALLNKSYKGLRPKKISVNGNPDLDSIRKFTSIMLNKKAQRLKTSVCRWSKNSQYLKYNNWNSSECKPSLNWKH